MLAEVVYGSIGVMISDRPRTACYYCQQLSLQWQKKTNFANI